MSGVVEEEAEGAFGSGGCIDLAVGGTWAHTCNAAGIEPDKVSL